MLTTRETIDNLAKTEAVCNMLLDQVRAVNLHLFGQAAPPLPEGPKGETIKPQGFINQINDANRSVAAVLARAIQEVQFADKTLKGEREFGEEVEGKPRPEIRTMPHAITDEESAEIEKVVRQAVKSVEG